MAERKNPMTERAARSAIKGVSTGEREAAKVEETRATFIVDKSKVKRLKVYAAQQEKQIKEVIDEAITEYLEKHNIK